jgi:hypothetical protein
MLHRAVQWSQPPLSSFWSLFWLCDDWLLLVSFPAWFCAGA